MKIFLKSFFAFIIFSAVMVSAQTIKISGIVQNSPDKEVQINLPVDGKFFAANNVVVKINDNKYQFETKLEKAGFISIINDFVQAVIYAEPNKKYIVNFQDDTFSFEGKEAPKQKFLTDLGLFQDARTATDSEKNPTFEDKQKYYFDLEKENLQKLKKALSDKIISEKEYDVFSNLMTLKIQDLKSTDYYFTFREKYEKTTEKREEFKRIYLKYWEENFKKSFTNPYFQSYLAQTSYIDRMKGMDDIKNTGTLQFKTDVPYALELVKFYRKALPANLMELAWANKIYDGISEYKFEEEYINSFNEFKKTYPNSTLEKPLMPYVQKVIDYNSQNAEPQFVANYENINSFQQLFAKYKGKVLYIDMWATWCGPCRIELQYSKKNHDILEKMGVLPIYLSTDTDKADVLWKKMVKNLALNGLNMRANAQLKKEIDGVIKLGIPYYIIVGKDGTVKVWGAKRPSDQQDLFNQLKEYL